MERLEELSREHALPPGSADRLRRLLDLVETEPASITTVRAPERGADVHVADALVALALPEVRSARRLADLGAGAGFPGLVLALALPATEVVLVESVGRKAAFIRRAAAELGLANVSVEAVRAEAWTAGLGSCDVVTARALGSLPVLVEYAAPLLRVGGSLVAWKSRPEGAEERAGAGAAEILGLETPRRLRVAPYPGAGERSLYVSKKVRETPQGYPRRAGMARKRPRGTST